MIREQFPFSRGLLAVLTATLPLQGCGGGDAGAPAPPAEALADRAARLAREILIVDTHIDIPYRLREEMEDISQRTAKGDFDHPRAREGGLDAAFMSIYVPASYQESGGARELADELIDMVEGFESKWPDKFAVARSVADVERRFGSGVVSLPLGMENGAAIEGALGNLRHFHQRGIRYVTLTHSENNDICDSSYAKERRWNGLSPFGRDLVAEMNRLGVMIDVSHISDAAFDEVMEITAAPVIASHSSVRAFTPGWERNMSDEMIRRLAENGGVIGINYGSAFLTAAANRQSQAKWEAAGELAEQRGLDLDDEAVRQFLDGHERDHPMPLADLSDVVAHIDHVVALVGVDHVGLGSDFDGVGPTLPEGLKDVSQLPNLIAALLERGYSEGDVRKIAGGNFLRVWREVETTAARLRG